MAMTAPRRRWRYALTTLALTLAAIIAAGASIALAQSHRVRLDLTAARSQSLSPRTRAIIDGLSGPVDILVVNAPSADRSARRALADLLDALDRASTKLTITSIDAASIDGAPRFDDLLRRLAEPRRDLISAHAQSLEASLDAAASLADPLASLSHALETARAALPPDDRSRDALAAAAAAMRVRADELRALVASTATRKVLPHAGLNLPATDALREPIRALLEKVAKDLNALASLRAPGLSADPTVLRDRALAASDALSRLAPLDLLSLLRAVEAGPAVLLISDSALTAVAYDALLAAPGDERATRAGAEQLLATALASLTTPPPTVVLVHAVSPRLLDDQSNPESPDARAFFAGLLHRLSNLGHAVVEWPIALRDIEPALPQSTPARPAVYVIIPPTASAREASTAISRLAAVTRTLLERGENVLLTLEPSLFPRVGQPDPFVELVAPFAIHPDTGRPLVQRLSTPRGTLLWPEFRALAERTATHPLTAPLAGLSLSLPWPTPMRVDAPAAPILIIPDSPDVWGESQWLSFRAVPRDQRALTSEPPTRDPASDNVHGPWPVAAAAARPAPHSASGHAEQRLVVVGASAWFFDPVALEPDPNAPRPTALNPGNSELFDASLRWLAHQDDLLAPGAESVSTPRIPAMSASALTALRWGVTLIPPALVLLLGLLVHLVRR